MVRISAIYAGDDELEALFTLLDENKDHKVVMVSGDGVISKFRNGKCEPFPYASDNLAVTVTAGHAEVDMASYKTTNH